MTNEEMDKLGIFPTEFSFKHSRDLKVTWRGDDRWAIVDGGWCLTKKGKWEYERMPSSRTEAFLKRCRFTLDEALQRASQLPGDIKLRNINPEDIIR